MNKIKSKLLTNMSDVEGNEHFEAIATLLGAASADDLEGRMYFEPVLRKALRSALFQDGLFCGLHEIIKALGNGQALLCIKAENCNDDEYKKYVQALCEEHQIPFLTAPDNMHLGKYAGFCKLDDKGKKREVDQCSYIALKDWGKKGLTFGGTLSYGFGFCHIKDFFGYKKTGRFTIKRINQQ